MTALQAASVATFEERALEGLGKALKSMGYSGADLFQQMDRDGSGSINFNEFRDGIARTTGQSAPTPVLLAVWKLLDADGNDSISYDEILQLLGEENTGLRSAVEAIAGEPDPPSPPSSSGQPAALIVDKNFDQGEPIRIGFVSSLSLIHI